MYSTFACALVLSGVPRIDWTSAFVMPIRMLLSFAEDSHPARRTPASKAKTRAILDFISQLLWGCRPGFTLSPERRGGILMDEKKVFPRGGTKWQDVLRLKRLCAGSIDRAKSAGKTRVFPADFALSIDPAHNLLSRSTSCHFVPPLGKTFFSSMRIPPRRSGERVKPGRQPHSN